MYVGSVAGNVHGYTNKAYPVRTGTTTTEIDVNKYLTVTYFDDYNYRSLLYDSSNFGFDKLQLIGEQATNFFRQLQGQTTGSKIKVLDGGVTGGYTWLYSVNYYDDQKRLIQSVTDNYKGGKDRSTMVYDFVGKILKRKTTHTETDVTWRDVLGVSLNGNKLSRTAAGSTWNTSGAVSSQQLAVGQSGSMEFVVSEITSTKAIGFSDVNSDANYTTIDYAFYLTAASLKVYENGALKSTVAGSLVPGDVLRIERVGTTVKYFKNGVLVYTSLTASNTVLMADAAINTANATLVGVRTSFGSTPHSIVRRFTFDTAQRPLQTFHSIDNATEILLTQNVYNELGQLIDKKLHSTNSGATFKQSIDYRYNIRGWLTKMNDSDLTIQTGDPRDFFGIELLYDQTVAGIGNTQLYNGNISAIKWSKEQGVGTAKENAYSYSYDAMNRITAAAFKEKTSSWNAAANSGFSETGYTYDLNGNIKSLIRYDKRGSTAPMDNLVYDYGTGTTVSNKLLKVIRKVPCVG
ncbi:hypothetical protein FGG08_007645 [Glutinoglossum americanum]|uniref:Uncharacterized protein n=1 Tax=Glutinoglossum americanum TaxID=1670608 RepID=A0A9P8KZU9_9PEZI|nr:hypothetical protein FGG08_007645 [Glutinoglossum americanum]